MTITKNPTDTTHPFLKVLSKSRYKITNKNINLLSKLSNNRFILCQSGLGDFIIVTLILDKKTKKQYETTLYGFFSDRFKKIKMITDKKYGFLILYKFYNKKSVNFNFSSIDS